MAKGIKKRKSKNKKQNENFFILLALCTLMFLLVFAIFNSASTPKTKQQKVVISKQGVLSSTDTSARLFWQEFLQFRPNYVAGWIELAEIEYKDKNYQSAFNNYLKAKSASPNHKEVINFEENHSGLIEDYF